MGLVPLDEFEAWYEEESRRTIGHHQHAELSFSWISEPHIAALHHPELGVDEVDDLRVEAGSFVSSQDCLPVEDINPELDFFRSNLRNNIAIIASLHLRNIFQDKQVGTLLAFCLNHVDSVKSLAGTVKMNSFSRAW